MAGPLPGLMPGNTGMLPPQTPRLASASRFGVLAVSSSVRPPGSCGRPPRPSATYMTIFESFLTLQFAGEVVDVHGGVGVQGSGFRIQHAAMSIGIQRFIVAKSSGTARVPTLRPLVSGQRGR